MKVTPTTAAQDTLETDGIDNLDLTDMDLERIVAVYKALDVDGTCALDRKDRNGPSWWRYRLTHHRYRLTHHR